MPATKIRTTLRVEVLGALRVFGDGREIEVAGPRLRALLCRLAVEPGRRVSAGELVDAVWPNDPPAEPGNALQALISRLRRLLRDSGAIVPDAGGYRLNAAEVDAAEFGRHIAKARELRTSGDQAARAELAAALELWRGDPLADAGESDYADGYRARWSDQHLRATTEWLASAIDRGEAAAVLADLEHLAAAHPLNESALALLLRGLVAAGRAPEALTRYEQARQSLAEALGVDPGPELQALHLALLRGEVPVPTATAPKPPATDRSNLPTLLTSFVGRESEVERVLRAVRTGRLTTIVGTGGAGKTRLATEVAHRWLAETNDTAWLIELAPVTDEATIPAAVLGALGLRDARIAERTDRLPQDAMDRLLQQLRESVCLLVIDNCEHLIDAVARVVDDILTRAPGVRVLTTSREPLAITGETLCPIPPLSLPPAAATVTEAADYPAVRLWLDRANSARPGFVLDGTSLGPVIEIVRRLDGLPLAIELAAARLRVLPVAEIAARLTDRFRLLTGGSRTSLPRHRTLRAVVEWSWDLLSPAERLLAERLAVFPAGADAESATAVCATGALDGADVDGLLIALVEKSLLQSIDGSPVRFRMLETLREYGIERLAERGELEAARLAHAAFFHQLVIELEPQLRSAGQLSALHRLNLERENVTAALRFLGESGRGADALQLCLALAWYWSLLDGATEAIGWMSFVLDVNEGSDDPNLMFVRAALTLSEFASDGNVDRQRHNQAGRVWTDIRAGVADLSEQFLDAPRPPFPGLEAAAPMIAMFGGRPDVANILMERSLQNGDPWLSAALHASIANWAENEGDVELMRSSADLAYTEFLAIGDRWGLSTSLLVRARLATLEGRLPDAVEAYTEAGRYIVELGSAEDDLFVKIRLADLYARLGDLDAARDQLYALRSQSGRPQLSRERELFAEAALVAVEAQAGNPRHALERARELRGQLDHLSSTAMFGHIAAVILITSGSIEAATGHLAAAEQDLVRAYPIALGTSDMPIVSTLGVGVASLAAARHDYEAAATILGAATQVRGAEDATDPMVSSVTADVRAALGAEFDARYAEGRSLPREEAIARLDPELLPR